MNVAPNRLDNLRALRLANLDAAFATAFATLVTGPFLVAYMNLYGASDTYLGLITAVPSFLGLIQIPGGIWGRSFTSYKRFIGPGAFIWRFLYLPLALVPLFAFPDQLALGILFACVCVAAASVQLVNPLYQDWLAELVPANSRGWFFSRRNAISAAVGSGLGLVGALIFDYLKQQGEIKSGLSVVFALGFVLAMVSFWFFLQMPRTQRLNPIPLNMRESLRALKSPMLDRQFRRLLVFFVLTVFGQGFAGMLWTKYGFESLGLSTTVLQLCAITMALSTVLTARMWGYLADKYGNKPILVFLGFGLALTPFIWILTIPGQPAYNNTLLIVGHLYNGAVWAGINICQLNILLGSAKPEERASYIGLGLAAQALVGALAPMVGAEMMKYMRLNFATADAYKLVFTTCAAFRFLAVFFLMPVKEEGSTSLRGALSQIKQVSPRRYRALKQLHSSSDPETREAALDTVASTSFQLASDDVLKALNDPSPRIRRQAAMAAARLGDERATDALLRFLKHQPGHIEEEMIEALGLIGSDAAVPALVEFLDDPSSQIRRAAAKALGRVGNTDAIEALMIAAEHLDDPDLRRASLQALRMLEAREAAPLFGDAVCAELPGTRIVAAEAISELELPLAPQLRISLQRYRDDAASEVAYALGCVGEPNDADAIHDIASRAKTAATRRRCLLGMARIYGVEEAAYALFLKEGVERDTALLELIKRNRSEEVEALRKALGKYSGGDEIEAIRILLSDMDHPELSGLAERKTSETFLVLVCLWESQYGRLRSGK